MPNTPFTQKLEQFRKEIDTIDHELFELILRRADIVQQVGDLKDKHDNTHVKLRPAREARQLKKIYDQFKTSPFPEASALMIWRHLINGSLMVESPLRILTLKSPQALPDFTREYFGCYAHMDFVDTSTQLLERLRTDEVDIGIFPMPTGRDNHPWWLSLARGETSLKIFLKFPYLPTQCVRDGEQALAVSMLADEAPNEGSHTALVLEIAPSVNPVEMKEAVASVLEGAHWHCSNKLDDEAVACFLTVPYVVGTTGKRLAELKEKLGKGKSRISIVGYFAAPLGEMNE